MRLRVLLLSAISIMLLSSPAFAARLQSWRFDPAKNQLDLTTDSGIRPQAFLLNNPTRLVIDLPGTTNLDDNTVRKSFGSAVREIRIGQPDPKTTRMVIELAPGYTVSPENSLVKGDSSSHWIVRFSSIDRTTPENTTSSEEKFLLKSATNLPLRGLFHSTRKCHRFILRSKS